MQKKYNIDEELYCDYCRLIVHPRDAEPGQDDYGGTFLCCPSCMTELEVYDGGQELDEGLYCDNCARGFSVNESEYCEKSDTYFCPICGIKLLNAK